MEQLNAGELDGFFETLRIFFANIPYDINLNDEKYYQSLFYAIFTLLGFQLEAEVRTHEVSPRTGEGRMTRTFSNINSTINCVLQTADTIYIIEFYWSPCSRQTSIRPSMAKKLNDSKEAALQQIRDKKYAQKYQNRSKEIVLLGVAFDQDSRNIGDYLMG